MRILILNYEFPPLGGGAGNATYYLLKEFAGYPDLQVDLITSSTAEARIEAFSHNVNIYFLNIGKRNGDLQHQDNGDLLLYGWKSHRLAKKLKKENEYDLTHAFFGIPCGYVAMKLGLPYIVSLRGSDVPGHNPEFGMAYRLLSGAIRKTWKNAESVIANSDDLRESARRFSPVECGVIPNGVDTDFFRPQVKKDKRFRLLFVGRLHRIKNIDLLIRSCAELVKRSPATALELLIAGAGPERDNLTRMSRDIGIDQSVRFLGQLTREELLYHYGQSSVFVLLSENEGMSNTVLEAMACGLPILTTPTGGSQKFICGNGMIIKKDARFIADRLRELLDAPMKLREMGENSRKIAEGMGWSKVAAEYFRIYRGVV